ncbi:MAG: methyl-accepting chemotaxis protein [Myxococcaceae bacterium]
MLTPRVDLPTNDATSPRPKLPRHVAPPGAPRTSAAPIFAAIAVALLAAVGVTAHALHSRDAAREAEKQKLLATELEPRRQDLEQAFRLIYQSVRTIGLLPSVRSVTGRNRRDEHDDAVKSGRFSLEGDRTVQQLFNNLAANVSVSEVYLVLDGFAPERGEVPLRMYDHVLLSPDDAHVEGAEDTEDDDAPEDFEDDEYAWYPRQLDALRALRPRLGTAALDDLPAVTSPVMRTCDNAQYTSKARGDVRDANGILYSAPIYDPKGEFHGLVSAVVRTNVLEARLLGVPSLVITDADRARAAKDGWAMPGVGDFVLANPARGVWLGDRRDPALVDRARALLAQHVDDPSLAAVKLTVRDDSTWWLVYRYRPAALAAVDHESLVRLIIELAALLVFAAAVILGPIGIYLKRARVLEVERRIAEIAAGGGDLTRRLDIDRTDEVGQLGRSFDALLERVHGLVLDIKRASSGVASGADELSRGSDQVSQLLTSQAARTEELSASITTLDTDSRHTAAEATQVSASATQSARLAEEGGTLVQRSTEAMRALLESSHRISSMVELVEEIAFQTNLLALNAGVEAARAGEHGKGFAVVADEVRHLAERTRKATAEIRATVNDGEQRTNQMQAVITESGQRLATIAKSVSEMASRVSNLAQRAESQATHFTQLSHTIEAIDRGTQGNATAAQQSTNVARQLTAQAERLSSLVGQFRVRDDWRS